MAYWTGQAGNVAGARDLFAGLLPVVERVVGPDHLEILISRSHLASFTGEAGEPARARSLFAALVADHQRVLVS